MCAAGRLVDLAASQFQIVQTFGWLTIPGTAFATFLYLGFLEIGQQMCVSPPDPSFPFTDLCYSENPFNYDLNDLGMSFYISLEFDELLIAWS